MRLAAFLALAFATLLPTAASAQVTVYEQKNPDNPDDVQRSLKLYGFLQPRFTYQQKDLRSENKVDNAPGFSVRRARLGTIAQPNKYTLLQAEFELLTSSVQGIDAFARLKPMPEVQFTVGQFRVPFSRQNLIQGFAHQMPDPAYFVDQKFIMDRDIGVQLGGDVADGKFIYALAVMNGNGPRFDKNDDDYFLFAGRMELALLGRFPRFEGDVRSDEDRQKPLFYVAGSAMQNRVRSISYKRRYAGADGSFIWQGASLYGEFYYRRDTPDGGPESAKLPNVTAIGFNVQAGYFPPLPYARDHVEVVARFQRFDPNREQKEFPLGDDLTATNPIQGFQGIGFGLNWFAERAHSTKVQASYELRNELKKCATSQRDTTITPSDAKCTGFVKNDVFILQATAAFLPGVIMTKLLVLLPLVVAGALAPVACQDTSNEGAVAAKPVSVGKCKYQVSTREGYKDIFTPKDSAEADKGVTVAQPNFRRIRLGLGGNVHPDASDHADPSTSVAIAWETDVGTNATWVQFGTSPDPSSWKAEDREFGLAYVVPANTGGNDQQLHEVHLCGLTTGTTYYYRVGGGPAGQEAWSDVLSFRTTPDPSADSEVTLAITGDSRGNQDNAWQILQERLYKRGDVTAQLFSGDIVDLAIDQKAYETWLDVGSTDTAGKRSMGGQVLTLIAMGNHENYNAQYFSTVVQPQDAKYDRKYDELFFSVDIGPVHVLLLDDLRVAKPNLDQDYTPLLTEWIKADLAKVDRTKQPWVVAVHHHPEWSSSNHGNEKDVLSVRERLTPIWEEGKVNLIFTGHDHNYERSKPVRNNQGQPNVGDGPTYIVCAGSGADGYSNGNSAFTATSAKYDGGGKIGVYGILKATRASLQFEAHYLTADGVDDQIDTFSLP